ncbi:type I-B CRISPR-associated protein Cas7/Cst2/DevR [Paenibacillus sp. PK4536]|uniref:type I-B CRISPR-associated protein Cas7/Cst2/DevR n=1 Tax=Paenibacillus sp. PK4536 TaxID=3024576 RepID=UPI0023589FAD|nr:type I-B CRISPR-associated protein Cas7/Cst2/DevR [Paenibacillus sp. PK4536]WIM38051.1 type I-B CRISPR-associated protein Cas7/Cst2/DevR [Paenibacillus sp. PK4536]
MSRALTFTVIFRANSLNYGEGIANISELKKIHRGNGEVLTFASRQSIRYDIVRLGNEWFDWNLNTVDKAKGTVQFKDNITIEDSVEMDLFGYLKTGNPSLKRPATVRLSHAISLEPYRFDMELLTNMGMAERIQETANLANIEQHESFYTYTVTIDLDHIGIDHQPRSNTHVEIEATQKSARLHQLLDVLKLLNRNIRGRQETLAPLFIIGGMYPVANPFFLGRVALKPHNKLWNIETKMLSEVGSSTFKGETMRDSTHIGYVSGIFRNESELKNVTSEDRIGTVEQFFESIKQEIKVYFEDRS